MGAGEQKMLKNFFQSTWRTNLQNQTMFEVYSDDIKSEYSSNSKDIFKYSTKIYIYIFIYKIYLYIAIVRQKSL